MNRTVGILVLLFLCGCSDNVEKDLAACKLQAIQIYEPGVSELKWEEPILSYIGICMTAAQAMSESTVSRVPCRRVFRSSPAGVRSIGSRRKGHDDE
jgi:hypothetical protein